MSDKSSPLLDHAAGLPEMIRAETMRLEGRLRRSIPTPDIYRLRQIILTGCGDSLIAGHSVATALRAWTGLAVQAMPAMEVSRYLDTPPVQADARGILVVCISNSGEAARVIEAARRLRAIGALTLAVTNSPSSRLAQAAELVIDLGVPQSATGANARGHAAALMALWLVGVRIAEVRMRITMEEADARRGLIARQADPVEHSLAACAAICAQAADRWSGHRNADLLGSGPCLGSAQFAAAKLVEATGIHASPQDIEEFHHLNYFVDRPEETPTIVFTAADAAAASRTRELTGTLQDLGRPTLLITDAAADTSSRQNQHLHLQLPTAEEWMLPLLHIAPAVMLAAAWAEQAGCTAFRGHAGPWAGAQQGRLVRDSFIQSKPQDRDERAT
jgi:glucosamine--fructose-6-phosphate aminotransferase (isomerizing)